MHDGRARVRRRRSERRNPQILLKDMFITLLELWFGVL
ncbi:unnamed protein product [Acanthoscelides obtectus]|uniref:Uncharacterized protein n=1 Tax=Acanthoscelides obtectus TaxID=200917 RepID=A0A9P0P219_ACAOB|nr:unnamed protein product [Acanthoscelides obtectus]CAK1665914.1 hypothetical protein AOBTE_LOCUS25045 [Acanthoscelides obtectus]